MFDKRETIVSNELQVPVMDDKQDDYDSNILPTWKAFFMVFRSFVGIGVLTMPHSVQSLGIYWSAIFFVIFAVTFLYVLDLVIKIAVDLGYTGSR